MLSLFANTSNYRQLASHSRHIHQLCEGYDSAGVQISRTCRFSHTAWYRKNYRMLTGQAVFGTWQGRLLKSQRVVCVVLPVDGWQQRARKVHQSLGIVPSKLRRRTHAVCDHILDVICSHGGCISAWSIDSKQRNLGAYTVIAATCNVA